jgi:methanogenic corrinoid protein MtbC1
MDRSRLDAKPAEAPSSDMPPCDRWAAEQEAAARWGLFAPNAVAPNDVDDVEQTEWLARTIETEIIPRLMLAHRGAQQTFPQAPLARSAPDADDVVELARLVLHNDAGVSATFVAGLRTAGMSLEVIYLELLAPAARHLGALWEADLCSFAEVTLGLWRLQQVMHGLGSAFQEDAAYNVHARRAMLVPVPGSQHTLGLFMVAEFFRRAGWDVWGDAMVSARDIVAAARAEWFDVIGISVATEAQFDALASVILAVRKASQNRSLVVIIGGPIVAMTPGLVARVGADATAENAPEAVVQAETLVAERSVRA